MFAERRRLGARIGSSANLGMASLRVRIALVLVFCDVILSFHISTPVPGRTQVSCPALLDETRVRMKSRSGPTARRQSFFVSARRLPSSEASAFDHPPQLQMCVCVCVCRALHFLQSCASVSVVGLLRFESTLSFWPRPSLLQRLLSCLPPSLPLSLPLLLLTGL